MAKELLIVEEPIVCDMCWLSVQKVKGVYCRYEHRYNEEHKKPIWCPLKPLPKRLLALVHIQSGNIVNIQEKSFADGWNACIEEIEG